MEDGPSRYNVETKSISFSFDAICTLLTIVFLILKLTHVIDWSWILIVLPTLINVGLFVLAFIVICVCILVGYIKDKVSDRRYNSGKSKRD